MRALWKKCMGLHAREYGKNYYCSFCFGYSWNSACSTKLNFHAKKVHIETKRNKLLELGNSNKPKLKLVAKWFLSFSCAFSRNVRVDQPNICFVRLFIRCLWYIYPFMKCRPHAFCRNVYFWEKSTNYGGLGPRSPNEYLNSIHSLGAWRCSTREKYSS